MPYFENFNNSDEIKMKTLQKNIAQQKQNILDLENEIKKKEYDLQKKIQRSIMQKREIDYKKNLINTRNRMLELSQEKNVFKSKVIYTLLAVIILIITIMLAVYVNFS